MINYLTHLFRSPVPVPQEHRSNFLHLYLDVFWYGILNGSTLTFLAVYATRSGATPSQIGLLTAAPALVNLLFTLPLGVWGSRFRLHTATCWAWAATRIFYLFLIPLPFFLSPSEQVWATILIILVMSIPGTLAAIIGNAFFAEVVPDEWRGQVVGTRNAILAFSTTITSLVSGQILGHMVFPSGYQVVFAIGFISSALSCLHLFLVRMPPGSSDSEKRPAPASAPLSMIQNFKSQIRLDILRGPFGLVLLLLIFYNLSVFIGQPVFPLYQVRILGFTDQTISLGTSVFWVIYFLGSTQVGMLSRRLGNQKLTTLGISLTAVSVMLFMVSYHPLIYIANNIVGGIGWSMLGGSVINFLFERVPANERTPYLTWYNLAVNAASLAGALFGSWMAEQIGLVESLAFVIVARIFAAVTILLWGRPSAAPSSPSLKSDSELT